MLLSAAFVSSFGCAGGQKGSTTPAGIESANLPYRILQARGGAEVSEADLYSKLGAARAVCIGESHSNPHHHWAQLHVIDKASAATQGAYGVGMEMFQHPFQGVLDDFGAGRIGDEELLSRSGWKERWGYDYELYRPIVHLGRDRGMSIVALNAAKELTKALSKKGIDGLTEDERAALPELNLEDASHRAWFDAVMEGHPHGKKGDEAAAKQMADRIYAAQVLWDETMADKAAAWLKAGQGRRLFIIAGNGHCHDSAIVGRIKRRGIDEVLSIQPIIDDGKGNLAEVLAAPQNDFLFVMSPPKR